MKQNEIKEIIVNKDKLDIDNILQFNYLTISQIEDIIEGSVVFYNDKVIVLTTATNNIILQVNSKIEKYDTTHNFITTKYMTKNITKIN